MRLRALKTIDDRHGLVAPGEVFHCGYENIRSGGQLLKGSRLPGTLAPHLLAQEYIQSLRAAYIYEDDDDE